MLLLFLAQSASISSFLANAIRAELSHPVQHVSIDISSNVEGVLTKTHADLAMNRTAGRYLLSNSRYNASGLVQARTYFLQGQSLLIYDRTRGQYELRTLPTAKTLGQALVSNLHIEPAILLAIDPATADSVLFKGLRASSGWSTSKANGEISFSRRMANGGHISKTTIGLNATILLPTTLSFGLDQKADTAYYRYIDFGDEAHFAPPNSARRVERFSSAKKQPKYLSAEAAVISKACQAAYDKIHWLVYKVDGTDGTTTVYWHGVQAKQIAPGVSWAYDGNVLTIKSGAKFVKVATIPEQISQYLSPLGSRIEPSLQSMMEGNNLLQSVFTQSFTARLAGTLMLDVPYKILELRGVSLRIQVRIRSDNHLIGGFMTENLDAKGHVLSGSWRTFTYFSVNKPMPVSTFRIGAGK